MPRSLIFDTDPECTNEPDSFFPQSTGPRATLDAARAIQICRRCPFRVPCLSWALEHREVGIWGGTTWDEREAITKKIAAAHPKRLTRYELYMRTQKMIEAGMSVEECAETLGLSASHVHYQRQLVQREIVSGRYRP